MQHEDLAKLIRELSPEEQTAVREFILLLKNRAMPESNTLFLAAVDEFIFEHPELLRRLSQ